MGVPKEQAARNRQTIIDAASRAFRARGVDGVAVADLMKAAGFTHGGFYNHFASKEALAAEACAAAFACGAASLKTATQGGGGAGAQALRAFMEDYLSPSHCDDPASGCPTAGLAIDAARNGQAMQAAYAEGIEAFIAAIAPFLTEPPGDPTARVAAIQLLAGVVGALVMARGVRSANPGLSEEILAAGRAQLAG